MHFFEARHIFLYFIGIATVLLFLAFVSSSLFLKNANEITLSDVIETPKAPEKYEIFIEDPVSVVNGIYNTWRCNGAPVPEEERKKNAVVSFLVSPESSYIRGCGVLGRSITQHTDSSTTGLYLMVLEDKEITSEQESYLSKSGWKICHVPLINALVPEKVFPRFRQQFTKLALWTWTEFQRVVYIDADALVVGDISSLFDCDGTPEPSSDFCAASDYSEGRHLERFNMGVFSIKPSVELFGKYHSMITTFTDYRLDMAEQGMLNKVYEQVPWHRLGRNMNVLLEMYAQDRPLWDSMESDFRVIHYTMIKPFNLEENAHERTWKPIQLWFEQEGQLNKLSTT